MNHEQFAAAIKALHAPLQRQQVRTNAMGEKYGAHSKEYKSEVRKEANLTLSMVAEEHKIWCQFCVFLFTQAIQAGKPKEEVLAKIIETGKHMEESKKPDWRNVYKSISSL